MPFRTLSRRAFTLAAVAAVAVGLGIGAGAAPAAAATGDGSPTDPNVKFFGRWDTTSATAFGSEWAGGYVRLGFTGTTVKLRQRNTIDFFASIDGGADVSFVNVSGTVNLTPTPLRSGNHTLRVSYRPVAGSYHGDAVFRGVVLDPGARTFVPTVSPKTVEFVGDSITVGQQSSKQALTAYGWLVGQRLGVEHTQIAQGGACLVATSDGCVGLSVQFAKLSALPDAADWDFRRYAATAVVINLGTNDVSHGVHTPEFQSTYLGLLQTVRSKYPNAVIFAMENFHARFAAQTRTAVAMRTSAGDANVFYVDTTGWIDPATDTTDGTHPNDAGHQKIAARLAPIISAKIGA
jgi:lysophospholipase L1-like esterase